MAGSTMLAESGLGLVMPGRQLGRRTPLGQPGVVRFALNRLDLQQHMGMLSTTELGALSTKYARLVSFEANGAGAARDHVALATQARHPEGVNHISTDDAEINGLTGRHD